MRAVLLLKDIVEGLDKVILENWVDKCFERKGWRFEVGGWRLEVGSWRFDVRCSMLEDQSLRVEEFSGWQRPIF